MNHRHNCPLCENKSTFSKTNNPEGKIFSCNTCKRFWIDEYSEEYLKRVSEGAVQEMQKKLSSHAQKSADDRLYVIREPKASEITGDGHGVARTSLVTEWINLSDYS